MNAPVRTLTPQPAGPCTGAAPTDSLAAGQSKFHESARAQVAGAATYIDDIPELRGTLHAAPVCSPVAHGKLLGLDASAALAVPVMFSHVWTSKPKHSISSRAVSVTWLVRPPPTRVTRTNRTGRCRGILADTNAYSPKASARMAMAKMTRNQRMSLMIARTVRTGRDTVNYNQVKII